MAGIPVKKEQRFCLICGEEFWVGGRLGHLTKAYCSKQCAGFARRSNGNISNHSGGYRYIRDNGRRVLYHRWVVEQLLGRPLLIGEVVHHINGNKADNSRENLAVMTRPQHMQLLDYLTRLYAQKHLDEVKEAVKEFTGQREG